MKQAYETKKFGAKRLALIEQLESIMQEYIDQGYRLTVRQLYYQCVARDMIENTVPSYKRLAEVVSDARMAGLLDWDAIEDRTREFIRRTRWEGGAEILKAASDSFHMDMWAEQPRRVFVVVEKEALAGVLERVCTRYDVPLLAARGYPSGTVLREFALSDLRPCVNSDQEPLILHLGDHDPSGVDMSRDLAERFCTFTLGKPGKRFAENLFKRIALNMDQIEDQKPPPNPAKQVDPRFQGYQQEFGDESWELDALKPEYIDGLVAEEIKAVIDQPKWKARNAEIAKIKTRIQQAARSFT